MNIRQHRCTERTRRNHLNLRRAARSRTVVTRSCGKIGVRLAARIGLELNRDFHHALFVRRNVTELQSKHFAPKTPFAVQNTVHIDVVLQNRRYQCGVQRIFENNPFPRLVRIVANRDGKCGTFAVSQNAGTHIHHSFINLFGYIKICVNVRLFCRVRNRYTLIRRRAVTVIAIKRSSVGNRCTSRTFKHLHVKSDFSRFARFEITYEHRQRIAAEIVKRKLIVEIHAAHQLHAGRERIGHYDILPCSSCLIAVLCGNGVGESIAYIGISDTCGLVDDRSSFALVNLNAAVRHGCFLAVIIEDSGIDNELALRTIIYGYIEAKNGLCACCDSIRRERNCFHRSIVRIIDRCRTIFLHIACKTYSVRQNVNHFHVLPVCGSCCAIGKANGVSDRIANCCGGLVCGLIARMTVCHAILNIHTVIRTALVRRIAAADEGGIFNVHTVSIAVHSYIKADSLGLVRRDLTERYGQGLAGIVVLIFCGVAVYGYIAAEGQSVRNGIGHNRVTDIHIRTGNVRRVYSVGDRITDLCGGFVCGLGNGQQRVTVRDCYTIVLVLHRVCIVRGQRCKVLNGGVVRRFVHRCGKADDLLCVRLNRADIDGQQAGILIVGIIVGVLAVQRDRTVFKGQSSRKNIGDNTVLNRNSCGIVILYGQRVRDLIANTGRGLVRRLVDLRLCLAVTNGYAVVLAAGVRRIVGLHNSGVVDGLSVCSGIDYRNESHRRAFLNGEITDLDGQNAGRFIIAVIVGQLAVQRNRAVLNIQSVRNSIGQHSVLDRYACELAVCQLDGVSHLIANIGSGLVRSLGDFRLGLAVTDLNALVLTLGVLDIITGEDSGVVYGLAISRLAHGHGESYGACRVRFQIADKHRQLAACVVVAVRIGLAIDLHTAVYEVKFSRNGICHFSVFDLVNSTVTVADLDGVGDLVTDICGFFIRSLGHIRRGIALFDIHAIVLILVGIGFLAVRGGHITVRALGNSGVVDRLIVHIAVDFCLESSNHGLASGNITETHGQRTVLCSVGSRYIVHIHAALNESQTGRNVVSQNNAFPCGTCLFIV